MWLSKSFVVLMTIFYLAAATNAYLDGEISVMVVLILIAVWGAASTWQLLKKEG